MQNVFFFLFFKIKIAMVKSTCKRVGRINRIPGRIQAILEKKGQVILYGPPGTGKTYRAKRDFKNTPEPAGPKAGKARSASKRMMMPCA